MGTVVLAFFLFSLSLFKLPIIKNDTSFEKYKTCKGQNDIFHPSSLILQKVTLIEFWGILPEFFYTQVHIQKYFLNTCIVLQLYYPIKYY